MKNISDQCKSCKKQVQPATHSKMGCSTPHMMGDACVRWDGVVLANVERAALDRVLSTMHLPNDDYPVLRALLRRMT